MGLLQRLRAGPPLPREDIRYRSGDLTITGILCRPAGPGPHPVIAVNHGGFDPASSVAGLVHMFAKQGWIAVAGDWRGTGGSDGEHEMAAGEVDDALASVDFARSLPEADPDRCAMFGISHGGAIAMLAAARRPHLLRAVVDVVGPADMAGWWSYVLANKDALPNCRRLYERLITVRGLADWGPDEWARRSPERFAGQVRCPVHMIYAAKDDMVPAEQGRRLEAALRRAGHEPEHVVDAEAGHYLDAAAWERVTPGFLNHLNRAVGLPEIRVE